MNLLILNQSLFQNLSKGILLIAKHSVRHKVQFAKVLCCGALCVCAAKATAWPFWWLPIVLLFIALVVFAIIMLVTCSLYRNRGEDYEGNTIRVLPVIANIVHFGKIALLTDMVKQTVIGVKCCSDSFRLFRCIFIAFV